MTESGMRPALYRSVVFWLWGFVLVFLLWAWVDSRTTQTRVSRIWTVVYSDGSAIGMQEEVRLDSGVLIFRWSGVTITDAALKKVYGSASYEREPAKLGERWFWKPMIARYPGAAKDVTMRHYHAEVPMWVVVGCHLVFGGGLLMWRQRRWRRSIQQAIDP